MASFPLDQIAANNQAALETFQSFVNISLDHLEKLSSHGLSSTRNSLLKQVDRVSDLLNAKDLGEVLARPGGRVQPQFEAAIAYYRGVYDISNHLRDDYAQLFGGSQAGLNKSIAASLDWYAKSAGNSELAVVAVKSALSAANSALESASKAARQVADITGASVKAATSATVRAVDSAAGSPARKKAA